MKFKFPVSKLRVVLVGVALGLLARLIIGDPANRIENDRHFNEPIDATSVESDPDFPDFPLEPPPPQPRSDK